MFHFRPATNWQANTLGGIRPFRGDAQQRGPLTLFHALSPQKISKHHARNRRAADALGLQGPQAAHGQKPFFVSTESNKAASGRLVIDYRADEWLSPEEERQMLELQNGADGLMTELSQADLELSALDSRIGHGLANADISLTAQQTFARIDDLMQRWSLRAEQIEQAALGNLWVPTGQSSFMPSPAHPRTVSRHSQPAPQSGAPTRHDQRQQPTAGPTSQARQRRERLQEKNLSRQPGADKNNLLRQQMNQLAAVPARVNGLRRVAVARLASLHPAIDHMAHELHDHRLQVENHIHSKSERRRTPRAAAPAAPVYKPKTKGETTT